MKYLKLGLILAGVVWLLSACSGGGMSLISLFAGSVDTSEIETQFIDVPYGTVSDAQTVNIYLPNEGEAPYPVIVVIHGGGFMSGSATSGDLEAMFDGLNRGYAVASINYRLSGEANFPAAVNDARAAIRFLKANAATYQLDSERMAVWGASAGANLASMVGTTAAVDDLNGDNLENLEQSSEVQAVVNWFGPIEFLAMDDQFAQLGIEPALGDTDRDGSPESRYIGQRISEVPDLAEQANPTSYINTLDPETAPSFFIQHGTADANVPILQSENFAQSLTDVLGEDRVKYHILEGAGHGTDEFYTEENLDLIFEFLASALN